jgi:hypothetical protein
MFVCMPVSRCLLAPLRHCDPAVRPAIKRVEGKLLIRGHRNHMQYMFGTGLKFKVNKKNVQIKQKNVLRNDARKYLPAFAEI